MGRNAHFRIKPLLLILAATFLWPHGCANVVPPTGGERDEDPPVVIRSTPQNYSTNFDSDQIRIFFDEFVELRNIQQQLLVSPPMEELPEVRIRGRSIIIDLEESLRPETTYNFFFGDAIRDITEGNAIPNFQFVLSTGDVLDSLMVGGQVKNAFDLEPEEGVYVMMYHSPYDSIPYKERPVYLAKTDGEGRFAISNMADGAYLMFALKDNNANFLFDLPDEEIGFADSLVRPGLPSESDTLASGYRLLLFQEADTMQRITGSSMLRQGLLAITFRLPFDSAYVKDLGRPNDPLEHIAEFSQAKDSLKLWFSSRDRDSLFLEVRDRDKILDTIVRPATPRQTPSRTTTDEPSALSLMMKHGRGIPAPYFQPLGIVSEHPIESFDLSGISLYASDTIPVEIEMAFTDKVRRNLEILPPPQEATSYRLDILPGSFTSILGLTNDSLSFRFSTNSPENYGILILNMELPNTQTDSQYILQLLGRENRILQERMLHETGKVEIPHLRAGSYGLRLIHDINRNGRWDTGNYLNKIQPEPVYIFPEAISVRENWEVEITWEPGMQHE